MFHVCCSQQRPASSDDRRDYRDKYDDRRPRQRDRSDSTDSRNYRRDREKYHRGPSRDRYYDSRRRDDDSLGREQRPSSRRPKEEPPKSAEWPPAFESDGAAYIFDARSGFFYEGASDFFFDPKNKLYYGNKQKTYYQYVPGETPPFRPISQKVGTEGQRDSSNQNTSTDSMEKKTSEDNKNGTEDKPLPKNSKRKEVDKGDKNMIAITIKKKKVTSVESVPIISAELIKTMNGGSMEPASNQPSQIQKKHAADIDKWAERGREIRSVSESPDSLALHADPQKWLVASMTCVMIAKTKSGQWACLLCKRKFANKDKLKQHFELSALHKLNMGKREEVKKAADISSSKEYRDRAKERRYMHGPEVSVSDKVQDNVLTTGPSLTQAREVVETDVVNPDENLGVSNIGNKMLQKLGWEGGVLGRKDNEGNNSEIKNKLKEDWSKIEFLARNDN